MEKKTNTYIEQGFIQGGGGRPGIFPPKAISLPPSWYGSTTVSVEKTNTYIEQGFIQEGGGGGGGETRDISPIEHANIS